MNKRIPLVTRNIIAEGLRQLGVEKGGLLLVHSSLSSFGRVQGGADAVIDALRDALGREGTLCFPTLSYGKFTPENPPPPFDPEVVPCIVGRIPETFRKRPGVMRSLHPTHSIAAVGPLAEKLLVGHEDSPTPCGPWSPWRKLCDWGGRVLMIGCGAGPMTLSHGPEEIAHIDVRCHEPARCLIKRGNIWIERRMRLHAPYERPGPSRPDLEPALEQAGALTRGRIGASDLLLIEADAVWRTMTDWCRRYPGRMGRQ